MNHDKNASFVRVNDRKSVLGLSLHFVGIVSVIASVVWSQEARASEPKNTVVANISVGSSPQGVVVSPDSSTAYVANFSSDTVSVISAQTNSVENTISVGKTPQDLAISSDGKTLYVSQYTNPGTVTVIDLANGNSIQTITGIGSNAWGMALSLVGRQLWVAAGNIYKIDTANNQVLGSITVPGGCTDVVFTPDGTKAYTTGWRGTISVINTTTGSVTTTVPIKNSFEPAGIAMRGNKAYVLVSLGLTNFGHLWIINTATDAVIKKVGLRGREVGSRPALLPGAPYLYIPEYLPSAVTLFDTGTKTLVGDGVTCPDGAYNVVIAPNGVRAYVTENLSNMVTVIAIQ